MEAGADIVNDVSGGTFDPVMFATVAELRVPMIIMHMRGGTPETVVDEKGTLAPTIPLRVHNVIKGVAQGVRIMEAILNAKE
jgi:dihydropteroate synthase